MPDAILICDASGAIRQVNRRFITLFGYEEDEILFQPVETLMPGHLRERHRGHRAHYQNAPEPRNMNDASRFVAKDKAGRELPVDIMLTPILNGAQPFYMAVIRDMTKQRQMENLLAQQCADLKEREVSLERQNALFEAALNNMTHGLVMFDAAGRLLVCNGRFCEIYAIESDESLIGADWDAFLTCLIRKELISEDSGSRVFDDWRGVASEWPETTIDLSLNDGRTIAISCRRMEGGGRVAVHRDITYRLRAEAEIHRLATHDFLTGLSNRFHLKERMARLRRTRQNTQLLALHYIDLDRFKQVNDNFGHRYGDLLLQKVAARLSQIVPPEDLIARVGGDEFVIVQPAVADATAAVCLATSIIAAISEPFRLNGKRAQIGASVGIALCNGRPDLANLLREADLALYEAKQDGKGLVRLFASTQLAHRHRPHQIESHLLGAVDRGEMSLHYQPIVDCDSLRLRGFEALLRWRNPQLGAVGPSEFIPIAEQNGAIVGLGLWVLERACRTALDWPPSLRVAVNVSPVQFSRPDFLAAVREILERTGLPGHRLELEMTESRLFLRDEVIMRGLAVLRDLGVKISADDFGTGYSSLHQLKNFPFDVIKIDRSFVSGDTTKSAEIVRAITGLAKGLGMKTIAEGVETHEQHQLVMSAGCEEIQGNLVSAPMSTDMVPIFLRRHDIFEGAA